MDLDSALDLISNNEEGEEKPEFEDPLLAEAEKDYRTRTHIDQYKTM